MCITPQASQISGSRLAGFSKNRRHTVFYGIDQFKSREKNALCFTVPTDELFSKANFVDASAAPSLTSKLLEAYMAKKNEGSRGGLMAKGLSYGIEIFDVGSWKVCVASQATVDEITAALATIPEDCRPEVTEEILAAFVTIGDPIVLACLPPTNGEMEDLVYSFVPRDVNTLILPGLDGHGEAPENTDVERDHHIFMSAPGCKANYTLDVTDWIAVVPALEALLPYELKGDRKILDFEAGELDGWYQNGDFSYDVAQLAAGDGDIDFVWPAGL